MMEIASHCPTQREAMKTKLQAARMARGWSQVQLMRAMEVAAERLGVELPAPSSLKTQVSMFENGRRIPGRDYGIVFCEVYETTRGELGLEDTLPKTDALPVLPSPRAPFPEASPEVLGYLKSVLIQHAHAEPLVGARFLVPAVQSQMPLIEELSEGASAANRTEVVRVGARYAEFLGWLHQDTGDSEAAMFWTIRALDYASELDDPALTSYVFQRRSNIAAEMGQPGHAIGLANAALRESQRLPEQVHAVALRASANAHALLGNATESFRALDEARSVIDQAVHDGGSLAPFCSAAYIDMEAANCALQLGRSQDAVRTLEASLTHWPAEQQRDRGLCLARLATAYAHQEDVEASYNAAVQAVAIAHSTGSSRILAELGRLQKRLAPWSKLVEIAALNQQLGTMRGS
jgi:tetratricopeptide (TPR) repeat protein